MRATCLLSLFFFSLILIILSAHVLAEPYNYEHFTPPPDSFGLGETTFKTVNWSYWTNWINNSVEYKLEKSENGKDHWIECTYLLHLIKDWDKNNITVKYTFQWVSIYDKYYRVSYKLDASSGLSSYNDESSHSAKSDRYLLNCTITDTESYNCYFNWSDYKNSDESSTTSFTKEIVTNSISSKPEFIWTVTTNDKMPNGKFISIDPTFGNTGESNTVGLSLKYNPYGLKAHPTSNGVANYIKIFVNNNTATNNMKCALYLFSDGSLLTNGVTEEKNVDVSSLTWVQFNFTGTKPVLTSGTDYLICGFANDTIYFGFDADGTDYVYKCTVGTYVLPDPHDKTEQWQSPMNMSIYCDYTSSWSNTAPVQSAFTVDGLGNNSVDIAKYPQLNITVADADGNNTIVYWSTNGSALYQINTSAGNRTCYDLNFSFASAYNTKYYVEISVNDTHDNVTKWYCFTTESEPWSNTCPVSSAESPTNGSTDVNINVDYWNITINDADGNATTGNITCSNGNWSSWSSQANGTRSCNLSTLSYDTNYTVWVNFTDTLGICSINETYWFITQAEGWTNNPPTIEQESPANTSTGIDLYPTLSIRVNDTDGNQSTVYWYTNASGSWYLMQTNNTVLNETVRLMNYTNVTSYSTTYYWKVSANDTHDNTTEIYHFTTKADADNSIPIITGEVPNNGAIDISLQPTCNVTISDNESGSASEHANWDTWGYNYLHTNVQPTTTSSPIPNSVLWSTNVTGSHDSYGSMCVHDGIVYVVGKDYDGVETTYWGRDNITALYLNNGTIKWEYEVGDDVGFDDSPTYYDGLLYVPTDGRLNKEDAQIICLYANNGTVKWNTSLPWINTGTGSAIIDTVNSLVILESVGELWGLHLSNGTIKYNITLGGKTESTVAYYNGFVYAAVNSVNSLTCHYSINGTLKWTASTDIVWDAGPLIVPEYNAVYMVQNGGSDPGDVEVSCVNLTTGVIFWNWSNNTESSRVATPAYYDGKLYCNLAGALWCINASTSAMSNATRELWNISAYSGGEYCSPALANGYLYYVSQSRHARCIDISDGTESWNHYMGTSSIYCGDAVVADGIFLFTYDDGKVYAFGNLTQYNTTLSNLTVTFATNESGSWVNKQTNTSCSNGSYSWIFTDADTNETKYWWRVYCDDGTDNVSATYFFTTVLSLNQVPVTSNPSPVNKSTDISVYTDISIDLTDAEGDYMSYELNLLDGGSISGSTHNATITLTGNHLLYNTNYTWWFNASDGVTSINESRWFITKTNTAPSLPSNPDPANESVDNPLSFTWSIDINDSDGDSFNWTIECNNTQNNSGNDSTNGTKSVDLSGLASNTTYTIWVNVTDGTDTISHWFTFNTSLVITTHIRITASTGRSDLSLIWLMIISVVGFAIILLLLFMVISSRFRKVD